MIRMGRSATLLILLVVAAGCADPLGTIAKELLVTSKAMAIVQNTMMQAEAAGVVDEPTTAAFLQICIQVDQAGKEGIAIAKSVAQLDPTTRGKLITILWPVMDAVDRLDSNRIPDPATRDKVKAALLTANASLRLIQAALGG